MLARQEFDTWWDQTFPGRPREDCPDDLIDVLAERIYQETMLGAVPLAQRRYFFHPDNWAKFFRKPVLRFNSQSKGAVLERARALAQEWSQIDPESRSIWMPAMAMNETPLEWFRRRRLAGGQE